jgi:GntR family transcriptional regulator, transcriptional repressor for pyruvate dehydrogenase complex
LSFNPIRKLSAAGKGGAGAVTEEMDADQQARRQPLVHEYVAEQLRREIALGLFASRSSLPPERELAAMFGVGIMTVHRAIRLLESELLITSRRGRGGGTFIVGGARDDGATQQLQAKARRDRQAIEEALDCRMELEPQVAARAARRRSAEDLTVLREVLDAAAVACDDVEFTKLDARFHVGIAEAARNRFLADTLERIRAELYVMLLLLPDTPLWQQRSLEEHERIFIALNEGNAERAARAAARHVRHTAASVRAMLHSL